MENSIPCKRTKLQFSKESRQERKEKETEETEKETMKNANKYELFDFQFPRDRRQIKPCYDI